MTIETQFADVGDVRLHYATAGSGPPIVLIHGWPETWFSWRHVMPLLADAFTLVAPDLRGLGDSSRPETGYDKRTVARDVARLMTETLGHSLFGVVGHDWGGGVAYALAATHRDAVSKLAILDVTVPGDGLDGFSQGGRRWHHALHREPHLPEALVAGREDVYLGWFWTTFGDREDAIAPEAKAEYLRTYRDPKALRAGFELYRAMPRDMSDNAASIAEGLLDMPVLALGGTGGRGRGLEVLESCRQVARDVRGGVVERCGHWMAEEQPEEVARLLRAFFLEGNVATSP